MNKNWKKFKANYVPNMIAAVFCFTLLFFFMALANNSWQVSLARALPVATCMTIVLWGLGFYHEEIYKGKVRLNKFKSILYPTFDSLGFSIIDDSYLEGKFQEFLTRIYWFKSSNSRRIEEITLQIFFVKDTPTDLNDLTNKFAELKLNGSYKFNPGILYFKTPCPADPQETRRSLEEIVLVLTSFGFNPIDIKSWEDKYSAVYREAEKRIDNSQTKNRFKLFGHNFDIKLKKMN